MLLVIYIPPTAHETKDSIPLKQKQEEEKELTL